ncbi:hypothetical protein N7468_008983 [Penicillium chermesinum]|uniref:DnaJ-domain-containing protein n=1 Tax=Penicillium chermesinum TaxID=63820 RepID=A0A9W9NGY1_9EURO|nr:uncharacterized protein N7468_008983 [Penicillium chermesinum]KAJ5219779.1 hypothetical protein N7468_008983 [Penicillium chermesinum]
MGQSQSTGSTGPEATPTSEQKTDYYELLSVSRTATDEEIKKAYRKKALELHPDRNYGNVEEATRLFAEVQSAYEVLADPQERAWYDSHSDAFLGTGGAGDGAQHSYNIKLTTAEDVLKVFSKFNPRMEFSDSPTGFYGGLRDQFSRLALEERLACQWEGQDEVEYPSFGSHADNFETVVRPFYAAWSGFSTRKSFAWRDIYRYSEAPDRRVRRMMEKENRRLREEGIREFNEAVRSLVAFVKKRDPRWKANAQSEAQRQEALRSSVAAQAARSRAINNAKMREHVVPEWAQSEQLPSDEESSEGEIESFTCVACNKSFKSKKQLEAHERSKKHVKAVKELCRKMRFENVEFDLNPIADIEAHDAAAMDDHQTLDQMYSRDGHPNIQDTSDDGKDQQQEPLDRGNPASGDNGSSANVESPSSNSDEDDYAPRHSVAARLYSDLSEVQQGPAPVSHLAEELSTNTLAEQSPALR